MTTNIATAHPMTDSVPEAIRANFDAQQAISASVANTLSECLTKFGAMQLDAAKAALAESFGVARDFFSAANLPLASGLPKRPIQYDLAAFASPASSTRPLLPARHRVRELRVHQERAKEEERKRIARELHDELGSLLTCVKAHISVAQSRLDSAGAPENAALATASALVDEAIETVRRIIVDLRPSVLDQLGIWAALEWYADRINTHQGLSCELQVADEAAAADVDPERSTALFRIVQEAITNVLRHAAARNVRIRADLRDAILLVEIRDDGRGIEPGRARESYGIEGMRERALSVGGELMITSAAGAGTCVTLRMPLRGCHDE